MTGRLLTSGLKSNHFGQYWMRVILKHLVKLGRLSGATLEDHLEALAQLFELLVRQESIGPEDLSIRLDASMKAAVAKILTTAATSIRNLSSTDPAALSALRRIADRTRAAALRERDLGLQIGRLLEKKGFCDFDIVNAQYRATPRPDGIPTVQGVISKYRGLVVHEAFFDFTTQCDLDDVVIIEHHLYDLALRLALSYLGYNGTYTPPVAPLGGARTLDWVTGTTVAAELGYGRRSVERQQAR
jgi:hypothetical protein